MGWYVLSVINLLAVFTASSALQLLCGNATDDIRWRTTKFASNYRVSWRV